MWCLLKMTRAAGARTIVAVDVVPFLDRFG